MTTAPDRLLLRLEWRVLRRLDGRIQGALPHAVPRLGPRLRRPARVRRDRTTPGTSTGTRPPGSNEPQVRQFTEDRDLTVWLVLDRSASMTVGTPGRGKHDVLAELALDPGPAVRPRRQPGRRAAATTAARPASSRPAPAAATRCGSATSWTAPPQPPPATGTTDFAAMLDATASAGPAPVADHRRLRLHRHRRVGQAAAAARPPARRRGAAGDRRGRRRAARRRPDRRRGRRDRRAAARRLQRPAVPRPAPGRRRRARRRARRPDAPGAGVPLHRIDTDRDLVDALVEVVAGTRWRRA